MDADLDGRITFPVTGPSDLEQLVGLRIEAMRDSLERAGRFDPARARQRLVTSFAPEHTRFIAWDGKVVGFYAFRPSDDGFHLDHLYIVPGYQRAGIGGYVLAKLIAQASQQRLPIHVGALRGSDSNRFYLHHGFELAREEEWDLYYVRQCC